ncbi:MAG TPA: Gfo/Idh/MocA family oxidoreductase [Candidatus Hydrogenedentes bacterium]|nr:Gfo/Idh/MocA family oxidoreductase [Candidatus Hydrogenedentota bacterium]
MGALRAGVIGVGHLGYHHARNYAALDGVALVGVVDLDQSRAAKAAHDFGTAAYRSVSELLEAGIDAASVVVPTTAHAEVTATLLQAGVDVLVEKPIADTVAAAEAMVALAAAKERVLQVGHIERFNGAVIALTQAMQTPRFIECHRLSPYPSRGDDVSVVLDLMIHDLDIVLALERSEVVSLDAVGVPVFSRSEDIANVRLRFASGCVANLTSSRVSLERMRKIRIFGDDAYVSTDYSEQQVLVYRKRPGTPPADTSPMAWITIDRLTVEQEEPLKRELASFVECVKSRRRPVVSGEEGMRALRLAQDVIAFIREHA